MSDSIMQLRGHVRRFIRLFGLLEQSVTPCGYRLSLSQVFAMEELEHTTLAVGELALRLGLERSTVSRLADSLVKEGFVQREPNERNRREMLLTLSDKGRRSITVVREKSIGYYEQLLEGMDAEQLRSVTTGFQLFADRLALKRGVDHE